MEKIAEIRLDYGQIGMLIYLAKEKRDVFKKHKIENLELNEMIETLENQLITAKRNEYSWILESAK
jgi:hypothetical protein